MTAVTKYILAINCGSATVKFSLFTLEKLRCRLTGIVERIGLSHSFFRYQADGRQAVRKNYPAGIKTQADALKIILKEIKLCGYAILLVGHRVVHGAEEFIQPTRLTPAVVKRLKVYSQLAPLHNPANLAGITACFKLLPGHLNIACFDTAFYSSLKPKAYLYGLPYQLYQRQRIRRYGFHGLSHQFVAEAASQRLNRPLKKLNLITCHLGSGCSLTAIEKGRAIDTTMGFTPLEGLVMATRSGDLDPGIIFYLIDQLKMSSKAVAELLNHASGWLGLSGISADLREVLTVAGYPVAGFQLKQRFSPAKRKQAKLALDVFIYRIQRYLGAFLSILKRTDAIVFTAGIGERNPTVRRLILSGLAKPKATRVLVIPTNEELMIARLSLRYQKKQNR